MRETIAELFRYRELLYMIAWREIKVKYKQSVMGILWAVLMPSIIVGAGFIVRYAFATVSGSALKTSDLASVAVKAAPWAFFVSVLRFGANSLVANSALVTKIYFPRLVFPLATVFSQLFDFFIAGAVVGAFLLFFRVGWSVHLLWLPLLLGLLIVLAATLAIIFAATTLFFRDVKYIVEVILTFAIFFTPVFYESSMFGRWAPLLLANPVSPLLEGISTIVVDHQNPPVAWILYSFMITAILFGAALAMFRRLEPYFAESI